MFLGQNPLGERVRVVRLQHRNHPLRHDHTMIQMLIDKMDRAAGHPHAVVEGLRLRFKAGKGRQQRGMNVENAIGKSGYELRRQKPHVAGQADQLHAMLAQAGDHIGVVLGASAGFGDEDGFRQPQLTRGLQAGGLGHIRNDDSDFDAKQTAAANRLGNGQEVRPPAGEQDAQAERSTRAAHVY